MPTVRHELDDVLRLTGVTRDDVFKTIPQFKGEVKQETEKEVSIELESDRPDLLSLHGLSRAIRSYLGVEVGLPKCTKVSLEYAFEVEVKEARLRPIVSFAVAKGVLFDPRTIKVFMNLQEILHSTIGRDRRKMAIGVHDLDKISPPVIYTEVTPNSRIVPLGFTEEMSLEDVLDRHEKGVAYRHLLMKSDAFPVFMDTTGIFSFPPVINSERTRVTEETENLFIEMTGTDERAVNCAMAIIAADLVDMGATLEGIKMKLRGYERLVPRLSPLERVLDLDYAEEIIGIKLSDEEAKDMLARMGHEAEVLEGRRFLVKMPPYRFDILHQVDLIEDLAIAYGYEKLTPELPPIATVGRRSNVSILESRIRTTLIGLSFQEVLTFTLSNAKLQCYLMNLGHDEELVELENPVTEELSCLRKWILPGLVNFLAQNKHSKYPQMIFELGYVFQLGDNETATSTYRNLGGAIIGSGVTFNDARAVVDALSRSMNWKLKFANEDHPSFIEGRTAAIIREDKRIGVVGEIHPKILNNFELEFPISGFEITLLGPLPYVR